MAASQVGRHKALTTPRVYGLRVALMAAERAGRVGARMRERREELGLTQPQVADRIPVASVTKDYISRWERGKVETSDAYLELAAAALETTIADLMGGPLADRQPKGPTPEPFPNGNGLEAQVTRLVEAVSALDEQLRLLRAEAATRDAEALKRIEEGFHSIHQALRQQPR